MAGDTFVEAIFAEDAEGRGESALEVFALLVLVLELGRAKIVRSVSEFYLRQGL